MIGEPKPGGTAAGRQLVATDASPEASQGPATGAGTPQPAADSVRDHLIRELGAILAGWGVAEGDDDILAPLADSLAGLLAAGPGDGA